MCLFSNIDENIAVLQPALSYENSNKTNLHPVFVIEFRCTGRRTFVLHYDSQQC